MTATTTTRRSGNGTQWALVINDERHTYDETRYYQINVAPVWTGESSHETEPPHGMLFTSLRISCQADSSRAGRGTYGWAADYRNLDVRDVAQAEAILKTLRRIDKSLIAQRELAGSPTSFADYAGSVARALGLSFARYSQAADGYTAMTVGDGVEHIRYLERKWVEEVSATHAMIYTTAPESYDHGQAETLAQVGHRDGKLVRRIRVPVDARDWSINRYRSGLYLAALDTEWDGQLDAVVVA